MHVLIRHGVKERASLEQRGVRTSSDNHTCELTLLNALLEFSCQRLQRTA